MGKIVLEMIYNSSTKKTFPQVVAIATAHNHEYQVQRGALYTMALDLTLFRHESERFFRGLDAVQRPTGLDPYAKLVKLELTLF